MDNLNYLVRLLFEKEWDDGDCRASSNYWTYNGYNVGDDILQATNLAASFIRNTGQSKLALKEMIRFVEDAKRQGVWPDPDGYGAGTLVDIRRYLNQFGQRYGMDSEVDLEFVFSSGKVDVNEFSWANAPLEDQLPEQRILLDDFCHGAYSDCLYRCMATELYEQQIEFQLLAIVCLQRLADKSEDLDQWRAQVLEKRPYTSMENLLQCLFGETTPDPQHWLATFGSDVLFAKACFYTACHKISRQEMRQAKTWLTRALLMSERVFESQLAYYDLDRVVRAPRPNILY